MILITEVTGTVGVPLTGELPAGDAPFRALVCDPRRAARMLGPEVDFVERDYERPKALHAALAGIERLFLISPLTPRLADLEGRVIDAAVRVEVEHVVKLSTLGVLRGTEGLSSPEPRHYHRHRLSEGSRRSKWRNRSGGRRPWESTSDPGRSGKPTCVRLSSHASWR